MLPIIYFTFTRYSGLYFWSMIIANLGVMVYATGFGTLATALLSRQASGPLKLESV